MKDVIELLKKYSAHIIYILIIIVLLMCLNFSISKCSNTSKEYKNNIEALTDTIKYYKDKNGNLVATKLGFESDINTLKILNKQLYDEIETLKLRKGNLKNIYHIEGVIDHGKNDTVYIVKNDSINRGFYRTFNFNNDFRTLEGNISYIPDSLKFNIEKDYIKFDYTLAMDKNNKIYIKSDNPYVKYNEISGFTIQKEKKTHWSLGPSINFGYDPINNKPAFSIGASLNYGIIKW